MALAVGIAGWRTAVLGAAVGAAAGFTFFDVAPYERWAITRAADVVTAVLLLVVGLAAGELAVRVGRQGRGRSPVDERLTRIREAARRLAEGEELGPMIGSVAEQLQGMLALRSCRFSMEPDDQELPAFDRDGALTGAGTGAGVPVATLPVLSLGAVVARFVMEAGPATSWDPAQVEVAITLADQVGAALAAQAPPADPTTPPPEGLAQPSGPRLRVVR